VGQVTICVLRRDLQDSAFQAATQKLLEKGRKTQNQRRPHHVESENDAFPKRISSSKQGHLFEGNHVSFSAV